MFKTGGYDIILIMSKTPTTKELLHKSKSSLTVVLGYLQMLQTTITSDDSEKSAQLLEKARQACLELESNIEKLENKK